MKVFSADGRTRYPLLTNNLARIRGTPTEVIGKYSPKKKNNEGWVSNAYRSVFTGSYKTPTARKLRVSTLHPARKEPLFKVGDHYTLRTREGEFFDKRFFANIYKEFNDRVKAGDKNMLAFLFYLHYGTTLSSHAFTS